MPDGMGSPRFAIVAGTVSAFTMFMPSIHEIRHAPANSELAEDCRFGYALALGWSALIGIVVASNQGEPGADLLTWLAVAGILVVIYESFIRSYPVHSNGS
jgi:uncharacterized membrane protein YobD (UPF0266 family)